MSELLYGRNPARECLRAGRRSFRRLLWAEGAQPRSAMEEFAGLARQKGCPVETRPRGELSQLARTGQHQGVLLEVGPYPYVDLSEMVAHVRQAGLSTALLLLLDRLQDPQNVGTLLRTAEAVGVQGVILPKHRAAEITPAVVKASAGATEHLAIARVTNVATTIQELKQVGLWIIGLDDSPQAEHYTAVDWSRPLGVVVGSEGFGLRRLVRDRCDGLVRLPMRGQIESLNAAVAGSIVLYEIWRGRTAAQGGTE